MGLALDRAKLRLKDGLELIGGKPTIYLVHGLFLALNLDLFAGDSMNFLPMFDAGCVLALMPLSTALMVVRSFLVLVLQEAVLNAIATSRMRLLV